MKPGEIWIGPNDDEAFRGKWEVIAVERWTGYYVVDIKRVHDGVMMLLNVLLWHAAPPGWTLAKTNDPVQWRLILEVEGPRAFHRLVKVG